jgi:integrase/recombinase XerC
VTRATAPAAFPSVPHAPYVTHTLKRLLPGIFQDQVQITYVTHLTEDGVDRRFIQVQVGHECDSSTAIYTHVSDDFMNTMLRRALAPALDPGKDR